MREREYVMQHLSRYASECPTLAGADLAAYLSQRLGEGWNGGSGWLPHVPRGDDGRDSGFFDPETRRVRPEWLTPEHCYSYSSRTRGVWIGPGCHIRAGKGKPDIAWLEVADYARPDVAAPRQLAMWEAVAA